MKPIKTKGKVRKIAGPTVEAVTAWTVWVYSESFGAWYDEGLFSTEAKAEEYARDCESFTAIVEISFPSLPIQETNDG